MSVSMAMGVVSLGGLRNLAGLARVGERLVDGGSVVMTIGSSEVKEVVLSIDELLGAADNGVGGVVDSQQCVEVSSVSVDKGSVFFSDFLSWGDSSTKHLQIKIYLVTNCPDLTHIEDKKSTNSAGTKITIPSN